MVSNPEHAHRSLAGLAEIHFAPYEMTQSFTAGLESSQALLLKLDGVRSSSSYLTAWTHRSPLSTLGHDPQGHLPASLLTEFGLPVGR